MSSGGNKTAPTGADVAAFLESVDQPDRREDAKRVMEIMADVTGCAPRMWGSSIIGFGQYHYRYESGREGDHLVTGLSPRKTALTLYIMGGFERHEALMARLGKYRTGKSCLYIASLDDVDEDVLRELIAESVAHMQRNYPTIME